MEREKVEIMEIPEKQKELRELLEKALAEISFAPQVLDFTEEIRGYKVHLDREGHFSKVSFNCVFSLNNRKMETPFHKGCRAVHKHGRWMKKFIYPTLEQVLYSVLRDIQCVEDHDEADFLVELGYNNNAENLRKGKLIYAQIKTTQMELDYLLYGTQLGTLLKENWEALQDEELWDLEDGKRKGMSDV